MKDRIKELVFAAIKNPANPFAETGNVGEIHCLDDEELEKFVSLIVADCAKISRDFVARLYSDLDAEYVAELIKRHFAVL